MSSFIQVKEVRYGDTFLLNIDNIVTINFNSNHILVNGTHGEGNGNFTLDTESMEKLFVAVKATQSPNQNQP
jgi:hypothetical protein